MEAYLILSIRKLSNIFFLVVVRRGGVFKSETPDYHHGPGWKYYLLYTFHEQSLVLADTKISSTCTKIELVYSGIAERTWTNTIIIYFNWIFTKNFTMNVNFFWYFLYVQCLSHLITLCFLFNIISLIHMSVYHTL